MKNITIHVRWGIGDPLVCVKLNGYKGKETEERGSDEVLKVISVIAVRLRSSFDVPVKITGRFKEIFEKGSED